MPSGTNAIVSVDGLLVGYCRQPSAGLSFQTTTATEYVIENGNYSIDPATLTIGGAAITSPLVLGTNQLSQRSTFQIGFKISSIIENNSYILVKTPSFSIYSYSTCAVSTNVAYAYTCQVVQDVENYFKVTFQQQVPAETVITFSATGVQNPKLEGQYTLSIFVHSSQGCLYGQGNNQISISAKTASAKLEVLPSNTYLNSYSETIVKLTPSQPHWAGTDYIILEVPYGLSPTLVCRGKSASINSMTCSQYNITAVRLTLSVDDAAYQINKTIQFSISHTLNPPQAGNNINYKSSVCTTTGTGLEPIVFETSPSFAGINYQNQMTFNYTKVEFASNLRGYADYVKYNTSIDSLVVQGSALQITFTDKFTNLSDTKLISSSPTMTLNKKSVDGRVLILEFQQSAAPRSSILFTLSMSNPIDSVISPSDIQIKLLQGSMRNLLSTDSPIKDSIGFVCDKNCQDCGQIYNKCTRCSAGMTLTRETCVEIALIKSQVLQVKKETSVPFICLGVAVILCVFMLMWGCICRRRLYWGNMLYSLMRPVHTASLVLFLFFSYENNESYWVLIAAITIIGIHLILSIAGSIFTTRAINKSTIGAQSSENKFVNALVDNYREKSKNQIETPRCGLMIAKILAPAVGFGVFRWFFSSSKFKKGHFWYYDTSSFDYVKSTLQRFQMIYIFFVHIAFIIIVSVSLAQTIYLFKIETISMSILDLLVYTIAYFELNPFKLRKSQKASQNKNDVKKEAENYMKIKDQNTSKIEDKSKIDDDSNVLEIDPKLRSKPDEDDQSQEDKSLNSDSINNIAKKKLKKRPRDIDTRTEKSDDTDNRVLQMPISHEEVNFSEAKSIQKLLKNDSDRRSSAHVQHFDPALSIPLARSTANYGEKSSEGNDHCYTSQHKPLADLESNIKQIQNEKKSINRNKNHHSSPLDIIYETHEGDEAAGTWQVVQGERQPLFRVNSLINTASDSGDSRLTSPPSRPVELKLRQPVEIQGEEDCYQEVPVLKDRNGNILDPARRAADGAFILDNGDRVYLQYKSEDELILGRVIDCNKIQRNIGDQDFELLAREGKLCDENGQVVDIHGQDIRDLESNIVKLGDGTVFNLNVQKEGLLKKGILVRTDGTCLNTKIPQEKSLLLKGLIQGPDGKTYRMIDQTAVALRSSELKGFGACKTGEPRAPKKPNKANFEFEDVSEDDPFRAEPSKTQSSLLLVKGKVGVLKTGLYDSRLNKGKREVQGLIDDDFSEYNGFAFKDRNGVDPESNEYKTATLNLSRGESRPDISLPYATDDGQHIPNRNAPEVTVTHDQSLKFIDDSPYLLKISNFINSSGMVRDSPGQGEFRRNNQGEIHSEVGEKSEETIGGSLQEKKKEGTLIKISQLRVSRTPKRQNTDTLGAKPGSP